jgi:hypothetical protein
MHITIIITFTCINMQFISNTHTSHSTCTYIQTHFTHDQSELNEEDYFCKLKPEYVYNLFFVFRYTYWHTHIKLLNSYNVSQLDKDIYSRDISLAIKIITRHWHWFIFDNSGRKRQLENLNGVNASRKIRLVDKYIFSNFINAWSVTSNESSKKYITFNVTFHKISILLNNNSISIYNFLQRKFSITHISIHTTHAL